VSASSNLPSNLLRKLAEKAESTITEPWVHGHVLRVRERLDSLHEEARGPADAGLAVLLARSDELAEIGRYSFTAVVNDLALGLEDDARAWWLEIQGASFDDRDRMLDEAGAAAVAAKRRRKAEWETVRSIALEVLKVAGQVALPILLAAL
jgi:hypothetical protein